MTSRQYLRLIESRTSDTYNDEYTPEQILQAEALAQSLQDYTDFIISQIRQILGTSDWKDGVPISLTEVAAQLSPDVVDATCEDTDAEGDCVYLSGDPFGGLYQVTQADVTTFDKMPAWGVIVSKAAPAECQVRYRGIVTGIYSGLTSGALYFVGTDGRPTVDGTSIPSRGFRQIFGLALTPDTLLLNGSMSMVRLA